MSSVCFVQPERLLFVAGTLILFIRINRARQPRFPIGIQDRTFKLVVSHLKSLDYHGPVGLACDDTKLLPALRPYYDQQHDSYCILGSTGEPRIIANPEELTTIIRNGEIEKASKVCQFC
jgi:hypothetical protein